MKTDSSDRFAVHLFTDLDISPHSEETERALTNKKPDEVRVVLGKKVIQIPEAGEGAVIVSGNMPIHGYSV